MFGSHLSIAGGMHHAVEAAEALGLDTVQVFTKNQQQWKCKPLEAKAVSTWRAAIERAGFTKTVSHDSYLINLASPDAALRKKSADLFVEEIRRCDTLGIPYLVSHPGAHMGAGESAGIKRFVKTLDAVLNRTKKCVGVTVCLEATAGQGSSLGHRLEHLAEMLTTSKFPERLGVCLDTAHLFAAGYDFRGKKFPTFWKHLGETIGHDAIKVMHLNDSKKALGSRVDRHEHIGLGEIGDDGFTPWLKKRALKKVPKILETAKGETDDRESWDAVNLRRLKSLA
ncbi:MAG: deoxyribonuclease IV [Planctomycetota bacterium]